MNLGKAWKLFERLLVRKE